MACLQSFMETADLLYVRLDAAGRVVACNGFAARVLACSREDLIGQDWFAGFVPDDTRAERAARFRQAVNRRELCVPQNDRNEIVTKHGERRVISWNVAVTSDGTAVDCVGTDVTDSHRLQLALQKSIRAAQEASASKSRYVAQMSHELRTPLNSIIGFSEIMQGEMFGAMPPAYREYSELIHRSARHLHRLIDDILDLAKIEASKLELACGEVGLGDLVDEAMSLAAGQALDQQVQLRRLDASNPRIWADALRAEQALVNILSNAIKFAPGTTVSIAIHSDAAGHHVSVADRGVGMTAEELAHAMQPFSQVQAGAAKRRGAGSGLGLPLARSLMELHGGALVVVSRPGIGTTVTLTFPLGSPASIRAA